MILLIYNNMNMELIFLFFADYPILGNEKSRHYICKIWVIITVRITL